MDTIRNKRNPPIHKRLLPDLLDHYAPALPPVSTPIFGLDLWDDATLVFLEALLDLPLSDHTKL